MITPASLTVASGATISLTASVFDREGRRLDGRTVSWASSEVSLASVTPAGVVTVRDVRSAAPATVVISAFADGTSGSATLTVTPVPAARVVVTPGLVFMAPGANATMTAAVEDAAGAVLPGRAVTWRSSDTSVVTVTASGLVTAQSYAGAATRTATITATADGRSGSATVTVTPRPVASVAVSPLAVTMTVGGTQQLAATVTDASGGTLVGRTVTWMSSDTTVVSVTASGLVAARSYAGAVTRAATITATVEGRSGSSTITVTPRPVAAVTVSPAAVTVPVGGAQQLTATVTDANNGVLVGRTVTWTSSDTSVVTVSSEGVVMARLYAGAATRTTTVVATSEGRSGVVPITVTPLAVAAVTVSPTTATVRAGETQQLVATVVDASAGVLVGRTVTWASSDTTVLTVSPSGLVTARAYAGTATRTATVTATVEARSASAIITVTPQGVSIVAVNLPVVIIPVGGEQALVATTRDAIGRTLTNRQVLWASSDSSVASVAVTGLTTALVTARPYVGPAIRAVTITASSDGASGTALVSVTPLPVATVEVSPATPTVIVGGTQTFSATTRDAFGVTLTGRTITWSSSDTTIAAVASTGTVTAKPYLGAATRTVTISASSEGRTGSAVLSISPANVASVSVTPATATVSVGGSQQLTAIPKDASGAPLADRPVTWISSDTTVAQVTMERIAMAMPYLGGATRTATITATSGGQSGSIVLTVRPTPVAAVTVSPPTTTMATGDTARLVAVLSSASQQSLTGRSVTWTSSNPAVATVSSSGLVTAVGNGSATVTATSEGRSGTANVTVSGAGVSGPPEVEFASSDGPSGYRAVGLLTDGLTFVRHSLGTVGRNESGRRVRASSR